MQCKNVTNDECSMANEMKPANIHLEQGWTECLFKCTVRWMSCNGEPWGLGPTAVFASAAALCLYNEMETALVKAPPPRPRLSPLERTLLVTMVMGMLALMVHMWVCCMLFIYYYLDAFITNSPNVLLEMTATGLLGPKADVLMLAPLTRFLRQQQAQIHMTLCWFLALCYADYVRTHHCQRFTLPYFTQWQGEVQTRMACLVCCVAERINRAMAAVQQWLHRCCFSSPSPAPGPPSAPQSDARRFCPDTCPITTDAATKTKLPTSRSFDTVLSVNGISVSHSGENLGCDVCLSCSRINDGVSNAPQGVGTSENTADVINSLKRYIKSTRCSCRDFQNTSKTSIPTSIKGNARKKGENLGNSTTNSKSIQ